MAPGRSLHPSDGWSGGQAFHEESKPISSVPPCAPEQHTAATQAQRLPGEISSCCIMRDQQLATNPDSRMPLLLCPPTVRTPPSSRSLPSRRPTPHPPSSGAPPFPPLRRPIFYSSESAPPRLSLPHSPPPELSTSNAPPGISFPLRFLLPPPRVPRYNCRRGPWWRRRRC